MRAVKAKNAETNNKQMKEEENEDLKESEEDLEVETLDVVLDDAGIDSLVKDLQELKKDKTSLIIPVEEELQIIIHHEGEPMEDEE